jgi:bifunctional non-homologous end joining protein LigD
VIVLRKPDKPVWPAAGWTRADSAAYLRSVAPVLLPHLAERPTTIRRLPDGLDGPGWFAVECRHAPPWLHRCRIEARDTSFDMCVLDSVDALVWAVDVGGVELHPLPRTCAEPEQPLLTLVDLDPGPGTGLVECAKLALRIRERVPHEPLVKTSGGGGLHLSLPPPATFAEAKAIVRALAEQLAGDLPDLVVTTQRREARIGRVLVDWLQNDPMRSTIAPYSLRAAPEPRVSAPVTWDEVERCAREDRPGLLVLGPRDVLERLDRLGDLSSSSSSRAA